MKLIKQLHETHVLAQAQQKTYEDVKFHKGFVQFMESLAQQFDVPIHAIYDARKQLRRPKPVLTVTKKFPNMYRTVPRSAVIIHLWRNQCR